MFYKASTAGYKTVFGSAKRKTLVHGERTLLTKFNFSKGTLVPKHQHPNEQTGYLISGLMRLTIGDQVNIVNPGDSWNLSEGMAHSVEVLEDSVAVEVFSPVREDYLP